MNAEWKRSLYKNDVVKHIRVCACVRVRLCSGKPKPDNSYVDSTSLQPNGLQVNKTKGSMRILSLSISRDAQLDASAIVPPVVAVFDHSGQFVTGSVPNPLSYFPPPLFLSLSIPLFPSVPL